MALLKKMKNGKRKFEKNLCLYRERGILL